MSGTANPVLSSTLPRSSSSTSPSLSTGTSSDKTVSPPRSSSSSAYSASTLSPSGSSRYPSSSSITVHRRTDSDKRVEGGESDDETDETQDPPSPITHTVHAHSKHKHTHSESREGDYNRRDSTQYSSQSDCRATETVNTFNPILVQEVPFHAWVFDYGAKLMKPINDLDDAWDFGGVHIRARLWAIPDLASSIVKTSVELVSFLAAGAINAVLAGIAYASIDASSAVRSYVFVGINSRAHSQYAEVLKQQAWSVALLFVAIFYARGALRLAEKYDLAGVRNNGYGNPVWGVKCDGTRNTAFSSNYYKWNGDRPSV